MDHRSLTTAERAVIERLLSVEFREVEHFRAQVPAIEVTHECTCGCGTITFKVDAARAPSVLWDDGPEILVEGDAQSWLMLFQRDGWLSELEHVPGHGLPPEQLDAASIVPELKAESDFVDM